MLGGRGRGVLILKDKGLKFKCWFKLLVKIKENLPWMSRRTLSRYNKRRLYFAKFA